MVKPGQQAKAKCKIQDATNAVIGEVVDSFTILATALKTKLNKLYILVFKYWEVKKYYVKSITEQFNVLILYSSP